ncbi:MAG: phosphate ABC transporter permease PstA [Kiritimatiellia bacterium]|jgi:phosphate transport system permease protein
MQLTTRKTLDRAFTASGMLALGLLVVVLLLLLAPILIRGLGAVFFRGTVEHRRFLMEQFDRGSETALAQDLEAAEAARRPLYDALAAFEREQAERTPGERRAFAAEYREIRAAVLEMIGPDPNTDPPVLMRRRYGQTRWDRTLETRHKILNRRAWDYSGGVGRPVDDPREPRFRETALAPIFPIVRDQTEDLMLPRFTCYLGFFHDPPSDAHFFGGIGPEIRGTLLLTIGSMLIALPLGLIAAVYFQEFAAEGRLMSMLRACVNTLAGVPSIVFGLFGLAFFINTVGVSNGKSLLAGALTLALLILPTLIRAAEEAIRAVPQSYREAAYALGASKWRTIVSVILPAALPGILTGVVISMGRAAGETAPIIFTAAVSVGRSPTLRSFFTQPSPALSWNIYNLSTEHEAIEAIRHVQYGMVATLVVMVLLLNLVAIILRARVARKLKG